MKQIILLALFAMALGLSSCGMTKDCDCPSFSQVAENQSSRG